MNKRIAKKYLCPNRLDYHLLCKAQKYLQKRNNEYKRTIRLSKLIRDSNVSKLNEFIQGWYNLRPYIIKYIGYRDYPYDTHIGMIEAGHAEIEKYHKREDNSKNHDFTNLIEYTYLTLLYFSDRWCLSRVGRMDALVTEIKARK